MKPQLSWKVGGQQGEGIESTGEIFATAMSKKDIIYMDIDIFQSVSKVDIRIIKLEFLRRLFMQLVMI